MSPLLGAQAEVEVNRSMWTIMTHKTNGSTLATQGGAHSDRGVVRRG